MRLLKYSLAVLGFIAVAAVGYFDTYPVYFAKSFQLSEVECNQVASAVASNYARKNFPGMPIPDEVLKAEKDQTRQAKRTSNYIIDHNPQLNGILPGSLYEMLLMSCLASDGKVELN